MIYPSAAIVPVLQEPSEIKLQDVMVVKDESMKVCMIERKYALSTESMHYRLKVCMIE